MVQTSKHRWHLEGPKGNVLVEDLVLNSIREVIEYAKAYISSFSGWSYEINPLKESKNEI